MKFAFDLDDTITAAPECFASIINSLMDNGHEVHIITYRVPEYHTEQTIKELESYGIRYTKLHLTGLKEELCKELGIDLAIDDHATFHYQNCWRFTLGFVLIKKPGSYYMKKQVEDVRRGLFNVRNEEQIKNIADEVDKHTYKEGYDDGYTEGYDDGFQNEKE